MSSILLNIRLKVAGIREGCRQSCRNAWQPGGSRIGAVSSAKYEVLISGQDKHRSLKVWGTRHRQTEHGE